MRLSKTERETFRKWVKIVIPQMSKLEIFNQNYYTKNYCLTLRNNQGQKEMDHPTSYTPNNKNQLKISINKLIRVS
jgi:hypothetical protein